MSLATLNNSDGVDDAVGDAIGDAVGDAVGDREIAPLGFRRIAHSNTQQAEVSHVRTHTHYGQVSHWAWESSRNGIGHSIHMWQDLIHR